MYMYMYNIANKFCVQYTLYYMYRSRYMYACKKFLLAAA